jgi:dTDP-4-dehydrorhamnose 3,5-epimerase
MARLIKLDKFADGRGWSLNDIYLEHYRQANNPDESYYDSYKDPMEFQVNYSVLYPGVVKAWHRHKNQDDYFCVLKGMAQVGVYSDEEGAEKFFIGEHNPAVIHIKAGEWHGLTCVGNEPCGLLYLVTNKYDPRNPDEERAPYDSFVDAGWWKPENK